MSDCIFCKIIKGQLPAKIVYQDKNIIAFHDIHPKAPVHVLVIPRKHIKSLQEIEETDKNLMGELLLAVKKVAAKLKIKDSGFKLVINNGEDSGQLVFHLHLHLLGGWKKKSHWKV